MFGLGYYLVGPRLGNESSGFEVVISVVRSQRLFDVSPLGTFVLQDSPCAVSIPGE